MKKLAVEPVNTDHALLIQLRKDQVQGGLRHGLFELVLGHAAPCNQLAGANYSRINRQILVVPVVAR